MKSLADRMKAGVTPTDKFMAAEAAMAAGALQTAVVNPAPTLAAEAKQPAHVASREEKKAVVGDGSVIRENFSLPPSDSALIDALRKRVAAQGVLLNRSEILRAGLAALSALGNAQLVDIASQVPKMKAGRPKMR